MAIPQEFYIREASEKDARGPFNLEQIVSLAETGQVSPATLYYDAGAEQWAEVDSSDEVRAAIFPEKKKLKIKAKEITSSLNKPKSADQAPITVDEMLAAAEGRTAETSDKKDPAIAAANAARIGAWSAIVILVAAAAGEMLPASDSILAMNLDKLMTQPLAFVGALDLFLAVMLGLGVLSLYPFVRFRAAAGLGFFGLIFFLQGAQMPMLEAVGGAVGLYFCTILIGILPVSMAAAVGILGMGGASFYLLST